MREHDETAGADDAAQLGFKNEFGMSKILIKLTSNTVPDHLWATGGSPRRTLRSCPWESNLFGHPRHPRSLDLTVFPVDYGGMSLAKIDEPSGHEASPHTSLQNPKSHPLVLPQRQAELRDWNHFSACQKKVLSNKPYAGDLVGLEMCGENFNTAHAKRLYEH